MKIWIHRYRLEPQAIKNRAREGALIKCEWFGGYTGFSDLHPWPEFGEQELDVHLRSLAELKFTSLTENSMEFNYQDGGFRQRKRSAFLGLILPRSHRLVFDLEELSTEMLRQWSEQGFSHIKVKMGRNLTAETHILLQMIYSTTLLWRVDFNARITRDEFTAWWTGLDPAVKARIDFVEDPVREGELKISGPWANDWSKQARAQIRVVKPARERSEEVAQFERVIFTHGLDHPLGQATSLWAAARFYSQHPRKSEVCGLAATDFFKPNEFSKIWHCEGPRMKPVPGFGFGFDEQLSAIEWERVL